MTELPRQSDGPPVAELIYAVRDARQAEEEAWRVVQPLSYQYGRARAELAAGVILGLLGGDTPDEWEAALTELGLWPWSTAYLGPPEALGRELAAWLRFRDG